jgi:AcrR family transcriptional regulator
MPPRAVVVGADRGRTPTHNQEFPYALKVRAAVILIGDRIPLLNVERVSQMSGDHGEGRTYSSPLREKQREETRRLIVEAVSALLAEGEIHTFSVQDVADRAGVSYASVYRHFPTREALLEGTYEWASEVIAAEVGETRPGRLEDLPDWIGHSLPLFERYPDVSQALLVLMGALNLQPLARRTRDELLEELVRRDAPGLSPERIRPVAAVLRLLAGSHAWATLRQRFGLTPDEAATALRWSLDVLVREVRAEEKRAAVGRGADPE